MQYLTFKFLVGREHSLLSPVSLPPSYGFTFLEAWGQPNLLPAGVQDGFYRALTQDGWKLDRIESCAEPATNDRLPAYDGRREKPLLWVYSRPTPRPVYS